MKELQNGDGCYVSNTSESHALGNESEAVYIGKDIRGYSIAESESEGLRSWKYAVPITGPRYIPFDFDAFPRERVWIRFNTNQKYVALVTSVLEESVKCDAIFYSYKRCLKEFEISYDNCKTWGVCGVKVDD